MTGGIDQMEDNLLTSMISGLRDPRQAHVLRFNRDAPFALDIHVVQILVAHVTIADHPGELQNSIRQGRFPVVDVCDDAEVPDTLRGGERCFRVVGGHKRAVILSVSTR